MPISHNSPSVIQKRPNLIPNGWAVLHVVLERCPASSKRSIAHIQHRSFKNRECSFRDGLLTILHGSHKWARKEFCVNSPSVRLYIFTGGERIACLLALVGTACGLFAVATALISGAMILCGQQISDFPLCNKSFNLSYCGFNL